MALRSEARSRNRRRAVAQASGSSCRMYFSSTFGPFAFLRPLGPAYGYRQVFIDTFFGGFASLEVSYATHLLDELQIISGVGAVALALTVARRWPSSYSPVGRFGLRPLGLSCRLLRLCHLSAVPEI